MLKIAHIINPVKVSSSSDLFIAQPITFESMRRAAQWAGLGNEVSVKLFSTQYPEDTEVVPDYIRKQDDLTCSVLDEFEFNVPRKLPLISDILGRLIDVDADYFVYTNVDIGLMPHFYLSISKYIKDGHEAFVINRRTIPERYTSIDDLPYIYTEIGKIHKGYDCFVFSKHVLSKLELSRIAIGAPGVGIALFVNLYCMSQQFVLLDNHHLTFHIGNDKQWNNEKYADYKEYNKKQLTMVYETLKEKKYPLEEAKAYHKSFLAKNKFLEANSSKSSFLGRIKKFNS